MQQKLFFISLLLIAMEGFSQSHGVKIIGKVIDSNQTLPNVHVINQTTNIGVITNDIGRFEIFVKENDILLFSSLQHTNLLVVITSEIIHEKTITIRLKEDVTKLKEVVVHGLTGNLEKDMHKVPEDSIKMNFSYSPKDLAKISNIPSTKPPDARAMTDPTFGSGGVGASASIPAFALIKERKLREKLKKKREFPKKIVRELGKDFFTIDLKIPEQQINHFLTYCEPFDIDKKYYNNQIMEVISILKRESIGYQKIQNSN